MAITLHHRHEIIQIGVFETPAMDVFYLFRMTQDDSLTSLNRRLFGMTEHLFSRGKGKLVHQFYLLRLLGIVLNLRLDEYRVAGRVVPNMYAKGFDTDSIRFYQAYRTEDTERLRTFTKAPLRRTSTTYPWRFRLHGGVVNKNVQRILARIHSISDVKSEDGTTYQFLRILRIIKGDGGVGANALELQEIAFALLWLGYKSLLIDG